jgi:transitional endoplasmic reticulum ATPase
VGDIGWDDIGGLGGVKEELQATVGHSVRYADMFERCGVSPSKNLLLYGPPGCGKTLLAKATAKDISANFILIKCPELLSGEGDRRIQDKFSQARALQPCVVYLEEFEAIASGAHDAAARIVSQMAMSLDEILYAEKVFVFAATNRPDLIEPALLRPGRFDQLIYVPLPTEYGREEILAGALKKAPLDSSVSMSDLASMTEGLSGADLLEVCKRACKFAIRESIVAETTSDFVVGLEHFERALKYARPSVAEEDLYRYEHFNRILKQISNPSLNIKKNGRGK